MTSKHYTLSIEFKWWFKHLYWPALTTLNRFVVDYINLDAQPNPKKVAYWMRRGIKWKTDIKRI